MRPHILLLAAGASTRMGQSKQLMMFGGDALLVRATKAALSSQYPVTVVLGANADDHREVLKGLNVRIVENQDWRKGMGNSLKTGLTEALAADPAMDAVLIMLCDQPMVTSVYLIRMMETAAASGKPVVASSYGGTLGVPVVFRKSAFTRLMQIGDEAGAARLIRDRPSDVEPIDFPGGAIDLDTPEDVRRFQNPANSSV